MYRNVLESIEGIEIYPVISLLMFFIFFIVLLIRTLKIDNNFIKRMSELPLENENHSNNNFVGDNNG